MGSHLPLVAYFVFLVIGDEGSGVEEEVHVNKNAADYVDGVEDIEKDFDYFYNLEMMKRIVNDTLFVDDEQDYFNEVSSNHSDYLEIEMYGTDPYRTDSEYYEDSTEFDLVLDDLLLEEGLLETDLGKLDIEFLQPEPTEPVKTEVPKLKRMLNLTQILLIVLLICSTGILLIMACTSFSKYRLLNTEDKLEKTFSESKKTTLKDVDRKVLTKAGLVIPPNQWV